MSSVAAHDQRDNVSMKFSSRPSQIICLLALNVGLACKGVYAIDYGIYDARSLAMGGASVASGTGQHAQFSNPALLSTYVGKEENTRNGRVYLPTVVAQASSSVEDTLDVVDLELDDEINSAVVAFNTAPNAQNASTVATATQNLQTALTNLGSQDLDGDAFVGFSVSEPGDREGGSFYFGFRVIGDGRSTITQEDLDVLQSYIDSMNSIIAGAAPGALNPSLFDADGNLISPQDTVTSSALVSSLAIAEWGVSFSKEFEFLGQYIALGATPKIMRAEVYSENLTYANADLNYSEDKRNQFTVNLDIGAVWMIGEHFRLALASKDIAPKSFEGANGLIVETKARSRFGAAFVQKYISLGLDIDLQKNESLSGLLSTQDAALGMELSPLRWLDLRAGYRHDLEGVREDVLSAGLGFHTGRFVADLAFSTGSDRDGVGVQLGWTF